MSCIRYISCIHIIVSSEVLHELLIFVDTIPNALAGRSFEEARLVGCRFSSFQNWDRKVKCYWIQSFQMAEWSSNKLEKGMNDTFSPSLMPHARFLPKD